MPKLRHLAAALLLVWGCACACAEDPTRPDFPELATVAKRYRIQVLTGDLGLPAKTFHGAIDGKPASREELKRYAPLFAGEFGLYPEDLVKRVKLKRVVLCKDLAFGSQRRNAIPDWQHDTLYLDACRGAYAPAYLRKVIHHEFYHMVDYRDDGLVYSDERWSRLNPAGFKYGAGGRNAQDKSTSSLRTDKLPGFLNHYSTTGVEEDKAEVFTHLIVDPADVEAAAKKDPVLARKAARMKELMRSFCPDVDEAFWSRMKKVKRADK